MTTFHLLLSGTQPGYCYHITVRCTNREFRLTRPECREVLLGSALWRRAEQDDPRFSSALR